MKYSTKKKSCWMLYRTFSHKMLHAMQSLKTAMLLQKHFQQNEKDQLLDPEGDLPNEEPSPKALEVGRGTRFGRDYLKNYNQSSSSYVNPLGKQVVNAPSGNNNENAGPKEAFKCHVPKSITGVMREIWVNLKFFQH